MVELVWYPDRGYPWAIIAPVESGVYREPKEKKSLAGDFSLQHSLVGGGVPYRCTGLIHRHELSHRSLLAGANLTRWVRHLRHWC